MHSRNKEAMELIAKGWNALREVDRVIDYCELNDKRLIPLLRVIPVFVTHFLYDVIYITCVNPYSICLLRSFLIFASYYAYEVVPFLTLVKIFLWDFLTSPPFYM